MANLRANRITSTEVFETTGSVQFDGVNGTNLQISNSTDIQLGSGTNWTIEFWALRPDAFVDYDVIIGKGNGSGTYEWFVEGFADGAVDILYSANGTTTWTGQHEILSSMNLNQWYHFALVRNGTSFKAYIDGIETFSTAGFNIYAGTGDLHIGGYGGAAAQYPPIFISNVRIVNGVSIYTENFTPPTRELEVIPNTVLLACQSTTKADEEKTGKTITVNGNAVANELTPGLLTNVVKSGGSSAITGSVEFDGTGDYLSLSSSSDFAFGTGDFTIEMFVYKGSRTDTHILYDHRNTTGAQGLHPTIYYSGSNLHYYVNGSNIISTSNYTQNTWQHYAFVRSTSTNTIKLYINGIEVASASDTNDYVAPQSGAPYIGQNPGGSFYFDGFISNLRVIKGTALYTSNFIPPTRKLTKLPGTVLLCCQDNESVTTEVTGKTITANGDPTATRFTPQVGSDGSVEFAGPITINTENYFYLPTETTEQRDVINNNYGARGVFGGGAGSPANFNTMNYVTISSTGDAQDFGDLTQARRSCSALASSVRGIFAGGGEPGANSDIIEFLTIASTGNTQDFGDLTSGRGGNPSTLASSTRGIVAGGYADPAPGALDINSIDYITISSKGNAQDFGDQLSTSYGSLQAGLSSPTRGVIAGTYAGGTANVISYITIATTGDAKDFGDLTGNRRNVSAAASSTRGLIFGGYDGSSATNIIDFVTIQSTGNALTFGDILSARNNGTSCSSQIRALAGGGGSNTNTIEYVTISTTSNALDFGDLTVGTSQFGSCSNGHGGLG